MAMNTVQHMHMLHIGYKGDKLCAMKIGCKSHRLAM